MNLHEYQAKQILSKYGVSVPEGMVAETPEAALHAAKMVYEITHINTWAVKAQIHAGGRGKVGGIKIADTFDNVKIAAQAMLGKKLYTSQTGKDGKLVRKVLIEQSIFYPGPNEVKEYYVSILLDRTKGRYMVLYTTEGGMDIEAVAEKTPHLLFKEEIDPRVGFQPFQARKIANNLSITGKAQIEFVRFMQNLYRAFYRTDATLIEINPLVKASDDKIFAADAKMIIDDNALFRHKDLADIRDVYEDNPSEAEASCYGLNFVKLEGNVGCMVNGAGLAMATMDIIKYSGGEPANFLDVGGSANTTTVEAGFRIILKDTNVKVVFINIFGGIVRCDRVAQGVVDAYKAIGNVNIPVLVRLQGTNAELGKELIDHSGLKVSSATTLEDAALLINKLLKETIQN